MKEGIIGRAVTSVRLALARAVLWTAWHSAYGGMVVLLRRDHPLRTYLRGAIEEVFPAQLASLHHTNGLRVTSVTRWKVAGASYLTLSIFLPETKLIKSAIAIVSCITI